MQTLPLARHAMATRFELVLPGEDLVALRAAGEEALDEIDRIEQQLSLYKPSSEIAHVNAHAEERPVRVSPAVFRLIAQSVELSRRTRGAFEITVGPLVRCWGFTRGTGTFPPPEAIAQAREAVGSQHLELDAANFSVRFARPGMMIDLGSIGKGYALDRAAELLRENGIENALLHGGTSTVFAMGAHPIDGAWKVSIDRPPPEGETSPTPPAPLAVIPLRDEAISVSAVWGKSFRHEGRDYGHLIDPRTGWPAEHGLLGAAVSRHAAESDALSTAVLLAQPGELDQLRGGFSEFRALRLDVSGRLETVPSNFPGVL
jgi:FAD:protein FMN transferase